MVEGQLKKTIWKIVLHPIWKIVLHPAFNFQLFNDGKLPDPLQDIFHADPLHTFCCPALPLKTRAAFQSGPYNLMAGTERSGPP